MVPSSVRTAGRRTSEGSFLEHSKAKEVLGNLADRQVIELRFENPVNDLTETGEIVINRFSKWFRVWQPEP